MDLRFSAAENAFRHELRSFFRSEVPETIRKKVSENRHLSKEELVQSHKILHAKGLTVPHWPKEWGGADWTPVQHYIYTEELQYTGVPQPLPFNVSMCGPVVIAFGTPEQKKRFLPRMAALDDWWCQGFSEPGAGSDLAGLKTTAVRQGDHYVVNGQKTWTTLAQYADWIFCLCRTDPSAKKQLGISFLLIDMKTPGITVRPIVLMDGGNEVNEVFFDEVQVPVENLVHDEGKGWTVAKYLLGFERMGTGRIALSKRELQRVKELAAKAMKDGKPLLEDPRFRDRLTRVEVELMALEITNLRFLDQLRGGRPPGAEVSMLKIKGTEIQQSLTELMMQTAGPFATAYRPVDPEAAFDRFTASLAGRYMNVRKTTIYAGSNEIQRNIIAKMTLGL